MKRYLSVLVLVVILSVGAAVRFIGLGTNPVGFVDDEADEGYDAYSLLQTGKDQWGTSWPLLAFKGFGDYRPPLYTYLAVPSVALFGLTPFAVRLPSVVFGTLTVLAVFFFVGELFRESKRASALAMLSSAVLAVSPWHIGMSRIASGGNIAVFLVVLGLYVLLVARRKHGLFLIAGLVLGLSVYAYTASAASVPLMLATLIFLHKETFVKKMRIWTTATLVVFFFVAAPIIITGTTASRVRISQVNLTKDSGMIDLLNEKRGACQMHLSATLCRLTLNKYFVFAEKFIHNYLHHFSPNLLSIAGTSTQYSMLPTRGLLYLIELPFLLLGIYTAFRSKSKAGIFVTLLLLISALPDSITSDGHYSRYFISVPAWQILISIGLLRIADFGTGRLIIVPAVALLYLIEMFSFGVDYTTYFPYRYSRYSHYGYKELVTKIESYKDQYDKILVSSSVNDSKQYIFYLFYTKYDPLMFQRGLGIEKGLDTLGWVRVERVGSIYFVSDLPVISAQTAIADRELFIASPSEFPKKEYIPTLFDVKDKKGDVIFQAVDAADYLRCIRTICIPKETR